MEFLIIVGIAGLLASAAALSFGHVLGKSGLHDMTAKLRTELGQVAAFARRTGQDQVVTIRRSGQSTVISLGSRQFRIAEPLSTNWIAAAEAGTSSGQAAIVFFGAGGSSGGTLDIVEGQSKESIEIDWLTGRVRLGGRMK